MDFRERYNKVIQHDVPNTTRTTCKNITSSVICKYLCKNMSTVICMSLSKHNFGIVFKKKKKIILFLPLKLTH